MNISKFVMAGWTEAVRGEQGFLVADAIIRSSEKGTDDAAKCQKRKKKNQKSGLSHRKTPLFL
ncbi:MAG: hypothetical protein Q4D90_04900 [bacterium]|nr:hypothetical protein [bacterium]